MLKVKHTEKDVWRLEKNHQLTYRVEQLKYVKGQMSGKKEKKEMTQSRIHEVIQESLRDWFKKRELGTN